MTNRGREESYSIRCGLKNASGSGSEQEGDTIESIGSVTILEACLPKGVIDAFYFFDKSLADMDVRKGTKVKFAARKSEGEWKVTSIERYISPEEIEKEKMRRCQTIIGKVVAIDDKVTKIKYGKEKTDLQLIPAACLPQDFQVQQGDFLKIKIEANNLDDPESGGIVHSVEPTKKKRLIGQVMSSNGTFTVENHIYFDRQVCHQKRFPELNDWVLVDAIESEQRMLNWRAVSVRPSNIEKYTARHGESEDWRSTGNDAWATVLDELMRDKFGVRVYPEKSIGFSAVKVGSSSVREVRIENTAHNFITLRSVFMKGDQSVCKFETTCEVQPEEQGTIMTVGPNSVGVIRISCLPVMLGATRETAIFDFGSFFIGRHLTVTALADDANILDELKIREVGAQREWQSVRSEDSINNIIADRDRPIVRGIQPLRAPFFVQTRLQNNSIPDHMWKILQKEDESELIRRYPGVGQELKIETYLEKFRVALWLEEMDNIVIRRQYDMDNVILRLCGDCYRFEVPGLKEIHPPVLIGDPVSVTIDVDPERKKYEGYVSDIQWTEVSVRIGEHFTAAYKSTYVSVRFCIGRTTYKRAHHGIQLAVRHLKEEWLFPEETVPCKAPRIPYIELEEVVVNKDKLCSETATADLDPGAAGSERQGPNLFNKRTERPARGRGGSHFRATLGQRGLDRRLPSFKTAFESDTKGPSSCEPMTLTWFNEKLNPEQKNAVRRILRGQGRPLPYIVFGPPGTGKTVTIVEAILQVYFLDKNSRTLVVAPSNSAADVITEYLVASNKFGIGDFVRLVGFLRQESQIPENIRDFCADGDRLDTVARNRLIVCTCSTAGQFYRLGLDTGHFTHVFIDEAGYCTEPDAMIAASLVALDKAGQVILAGDPKQLGPVLMSDVAAKCGLSLSFLERLMSCPLYSRNEKAFPVEKYNPIVLTKLVKNYRAHATLLKLPSKLFYDDELEAAAPEESVNLFHSIEFLKNRGTPILFHGIQGTCEREADSASWFNRAEVIQVFHYVRQLREHGLTNDDIGIVTPYRKQVEKLKKALELGLLSDEIPKVGSVEEFQGGERKVVIMSLVRSARQHELEKVIDRFSFVFSPKRFNVAVTRAKAVLIVVGNPHVLVYDEIWLKFINYCIELNSYTGCNLPDSLERPPGSYRLEEMWRDGKTVGEKDEGYSDLKIDDLKINDKDLKEEPKKDGAELMLTTEDYDWSDELD